MGWLRRIFGIPGCECLFHSMADHRHTMLSSDESNASEEEWESPEYEVSEELNDKEEHNQIVKRRSLRVQQSSHQVSFGHGYELRPSPSCEMNVRCCYQGEVWNNEQCQVFRDHDILDSEHWGHYFFDQPKIDLGHYFFNKPKIGHEFLTSDHDIFDETLRCHLRCYVCGELIPYNEHGQHDYQEHPFWKQKYCSSHLCDGTPMCSCERLMVRDARCMVLNDDRRICSECLDTAVMNAEDCYQIYLEVKEYYKSIDMEVQETIPVRLVDRFEMENSHKKEDLVHRCSLTVGLFGWREPAIYTMIERKKYQLARHVKDPKFSILYGYPRIFTKSTMVHEMMHAWWTFGGQPEVDLEVEEGICEVMAHMWLSSEIKSLPSRHHREMRLGEFFKYNIETSQLPNYGSGFQKGYKSVMNCGLKWTLDYIRMSGNFPP
ncbi:hypothetical protein MLD38_004635 [Melastoma candidum]|uniref:Uncharacterized protein n=1 Tax=Melastoma candidum TaxID=119954 RepID=A0ACB9S675_9MYRT|nr:hypothetical protein MLD38_004635 [Melastoma candidum]